MNHFLPPDQRPEPLPVLFLVLLLFLPSPWLWGAGPPAVPGLARVDSEGEPLPAEALCRLGSTRLRHGGACSVLGFTPDGKRLITSGPDGVRIWNPATGRLVRFVDFPGVCLSADGKLLAGSIDDIRLYELDSGKVVRSFGKGRFTGLKLSPDGKRLVGHSEEGRAVLFEVATGRAICSIEIGPRAGNLVSFTPDSKRLLTWSHGNHPLRVWDACSGTLERELPLQGNETDPFALSSVGKLLACYRWGDKKSRAGVCLWNLTTGKRVRELLLPSGLDKAGEVVSLSFLPDGRGLLVEGFEEYLVMDAVTGKPVRRSRKSEPACWPGTVAPDGRTAAATNIATVRFIDLATGKDRCQTPGHQEGIRCVACSHDGRVVVTCAGYDSMIVWDTETARGRCLGNGPADTMLLTPDGRTLVTGAFHAPGSIRELATGRLVRRLPEGYLPLAICPDGSLGAVQHDGLLRWLDPRTGKEVRRGLDVGPRIWGAAFSPDGRALLLCSADLRVRRVDRATDKILSEWDIPLPDRPDQEVLQILEANPGPAAFSPDGKLLAYSWQAGSVILVLVDLDTRRIVHTVRAAGDSPAALAFSPDSRTLAWASRKDRGLHLVEVATGRERHRLRGGHLGVCEALAFSGDGQRLISGGDDSTALVWDLTGRLLLKARWAKAIPTEELAACWKELAADAAQGYRAGRRLVGSPNDALALLGRHLVPVPRADPQLIQHLLTDLSSARFESRQRASQELERLGETALPACREALERKPDLEAALRLKRIVNRLDKAIDHPPPEQVRLLRSVEVLELIGSAESRELLGRLAGGAPEARLTLESRAALERLTRRAR